MCKRIYFYRINNNFKQLYFLNWYKCGNKMDLQKTDLNIGLLALKTTFESA